jgi:serralysin
VGHILGLKHGHENSVFGAMAAQHDSMEHSVMTYRSYIGSDVSFLHNETYGFAQTFMMYDIAALQHMYGANFATYSGDTTYRWDPATGQASIDSVGRSIPASNRIFQTVWDGGGSDSYDFSNYTTRLTIDLQPGHWSTMSPVQLANLGDGHFARGNIANAMLYKGDTRSLIENAIGGSASDTITGNEGANTISGVAGSDSLLGWNGNDALFGGSGNDTISGGAGNDTLEGGVGEDRASFAGVTGDYIFSEVDGSIVVSHRAGFWGTDVTSSIEEFVFDDGVFSPATLLPAREPQPPIPPTPPPAVPKDPYWGDDLSNTLVGNAGNNVLKGFGGKDVLKGRSGNDALYGGSGNDKLYGGPGKDSFVFDTQPNRRSNKDTIYDFNVKDDTIRLENAVFTKLGPAGQLKSSAFWASKDGKAHDRSDRIIYDTDGGQIYYDADGSGRSSAVAFAQLSKNLALTYKDFYVL